MKLITAIIQPDRLDHVREALIQADITRITVSRVTGHGRQEDIELYRGQKIAPNLIPKIRLDIAVNDEFSALATLLVHLPRLLNPGGRVAILTFHSGEDRRVKKAFINGREAGVYSEISEDIIRASAAEQRSNPRSAPAKLRWARRSNI